MLKSSNDPLRLSKFFRMLFFRGLSFSAVSGSYEMLDAKQLGLKMFQALQIPWWENVLPAPLITRGKAPISTFPGEVHFLTELLGGTVRIGNIRLRIHTFSLSLSCTCVHAHTQYIAITDMFNLWRELVQETRMDPKNVRLTVFF